MGPYHDLAVVRGGVSPVPTRYWPKSHFVAFRNSCRGAGARGGLVQSSVSNETSDWGAGPHLVGLVVQVVERIFFWWWWRALVGLACCSCF